MHGIARRFACQAGWRQATCQPQGIGKSLLLGSLVHSTSLNASFRLSAG